MLAAIVGWALLLPAQPVASNSAPASLGVLEDVPDNDPEKPHTRRVRALFHFGAGNWTAFPHFPDDERELAALARRFPRRVLWSVCLGAKPLGTIHGRAAARFEHYSEVGLQRPVRAPVPSVGAPDERFSGFDSTPVLRPLAATSVGRCALPEAWVKVASPPAELKSRVVAALPSPEGYATSGVPTSEWPATYRGPNGRWIVEVHREWPDWADRRVVFIGPGGGLRVATGEPNSHVGRSGKSAALARGSIYPHLIVDIGDWNDDGRVEVLTKFEMYDLDGYILLTGDGEPLATFDWFYH